MTTSELTFVKEAIDPARLAAYSKDASPYVRRAVARHPLTPATTLTALGKDIDPRVRLAVAANTNTPVATLEALYERDSHRRPHALALAGNESTHDYLLTLLLKGAAHHGLSEVAAHRKTLPAGLVDWLIRGANLPTAIRLAQRSDLTTQQYTFLALRKEVWVQKALCDNAAAPEPIRERLQKMRLHRVPAPWELGSQQTRMALAKSDKTDNLTLWSLARDMNSYVRKAVAYNERTPYEILKFLAHDEESFVRRAVAEHPNADDEIFAAFLKGGKSNRWAAWSAVKRDDISPTLLTKFSRHPEEHVRWEVAKNTNTRLRVLERLAHDENEWVRAGVAGNPAHEGKAARLLTYDISEVVQESMATNPFCPRKTLIRFALCDSEKVATAAREQLGLPLGAFRSTIYSILRERGEEL